MSSLSNAVKRDTDQLFDQQEKLEIAVSGLFCCVRFRTDILSSLL